MDCDSAIRLDLKLVFAWNNRCLVYNKQGKYDLAIQDCNQAIRLRPGFDEAYINRGLSFWRNGDSAKAIEDFTKVLRESSSEKNRKLAESFLKEVQTSADK